MCLNRPFSKPKKKSGFGYKVFQIVDGKLRGDFYDSGPDRIPGKWLQTGRPGWHIFLTLQGAKDWSAGPPDGDIEDGYALVKIRYRQAARQGTQMDGKHPAITAREIFIPKNWKSQKNKA
jgi:hypothetical protein